MPTIEEIEEIEEIDVTDKEDVKGSPKGKGKVKDNIDVKVKDELEYFAKSIYDEFKDKFIQIYIESRHTSGLGCLVIDLDNSTVNDLDIAYYKIEDMTKEMIQVIGDNQNYQNTAYFIFISKKEFFVIEDHLKI
jgi:hypothetical protein